MHAPRIVCVLMNLPTFFFVVLDATRSCARLCPSHTHANDAAPAHCVSHATRPPARQPNAAKQRVASQHPLSANCAAKTTLVCLSVLSPWTAGLRSLPRSHHAGTTRDMKKFSKRSEARKEGAICVFGLLRRSRVQRIAPTSQSSRQRCSVNSWTRTQTFWGWLGYFLLRRSGRRTRWRPGRPSTAPPAPPATMSTSCFDASTLLPPSPSPSRPCPPSAWLSSLPFAVCASLKTPSVRARTYTCYPYPLMPCPSAVLRHPQGLVLPKCPGTRMNRSQR